MSKPGREWIEQSVRDDGPMRNTDPVWAAVFAAEYNSIQRGAEYKLGTEDHDRLIAHCVEYADVAVIGLRNWQYDAYEKKVEREQARRSGGSR